MGEVAGIRWRWLIIAIILCMAAFFRLYRLESVPPGFQFDEAYNALDALRVLDGQYPIFLEANGGREVLYTYLQAALVRVFGPNPLALRLTSALVGLATVLITYPFVLALFRYRESSPSPPPDDAPLIAALTTFFTATSYWHIHFSRYGIRSVTLPFLEICCFYFLWRGLEKGKVMLYAIAGFFLGLMAYTHPAGRLVPLTVTAFLLYKIVADHPRFKAHLKGWGIVALISFLVFIPLGRYFWLHPESFTGHPGLVSVFNPEVSGGDAWRAIGANLLAVAGMFVFRGDGALTHNLSGRPVFDPFVSLLFVLGVILSLTRLRGKAPDDRPTFVLLWLWMLIMLAPSILSHGAPNFSRAIGAIPTVFVFPALGVAALKRWAGARGRIAVSAIMALGLAFSAFWTYRDYFIVFANEPDSFYAYDGDKIDAVAYLKQAMNESHVYLSPLWAEHATVDFLTRGSPLKSFDTGQTLVVPSDAEGKDALYVFHVTQSSYITAFEQALAGVARREVVKNRYGAYLFTVFRIEAEDLPSAEHPLQSLVEKDFPLTPEHMTALDFNHEVRLLGYTLERGEVPAGRPLMVTLFWQAPHRISGDYTVFVHLLDEEGRKWGQQDMRPNDGGYPTTVWDAGEIVIDRYRPSVNPCAPPGEYHLVAGLYSFITGERLKVLDTGLDFASLGHFQVAAPRDRSLPSDVAPQNLLDAELSDEVRLWGYDRHENEAWPGDSVGLTLYWQALKDVKRDRTFVVSLSEKEGGWEQEIWRGEPVVPTSRWMAGDQLCDHHDLTIPLDTPAGRYEMTVSVTDEGARPASLGSLTVLEGVSVYRLGIGMYNALTGERLPALSADSQESVDRLPGDRVLLEPVIKVEAP